MLIIDAKSCFLFRNFKYDKEILSDNFDQLAKERKQNSIVTIEFFKMANRMCIVTINSNY